MSVIVYANGNRIGKGTHVAVYVHIAEGRNDSKLKWPFIGKVKIELLNQLKDGNHHIETVPFKMEHNARVGDIRNLGYSQFIPQSKLYHNLPKKTLRMTLCTSECQLEYLTTSLGWSTL